MQITFIINSRIKKLNTTLKEISDIFCELEEIQTTILQTYHAGHACELAKEATQQSCDYLISVGGDGTLNEVLNGMIESCIPTNNYPVLGIIPRGSANDFVRTINQPENIQLLKKSILARTSQKIDIGKIETDVVPNTPKYFINIAGLGLGPEVVKIMEKSNKFWGSTMTYFSAIIRGFLNYEKKGIRCESENWIWEGDLLQMAVANGKYFGDGICIAPDASVKDGELHISLFGELSIFDYLKNLGNLKKGKKIKHQGAYYFTSKVLRITQTGTNPCGIETDGEYAGELPITIKVIPDAIKMILT